MQLEGKIHAILETRGITDNLTVREFVILDASNEKYPQHIKFQLKNDRCRAIDGFNVGDAVRVSFNLGGRETAKGYFNTLDAWRVERV